MADYAFELVFFGGALAVPLVFLAVMTWESRRFDRRWGKEPPRGE